MLVQVITHSKKNKHKSNIILTLQYIFIYIKYIMLLILAISFRIHYTVEVLNGKV